MPFNLIGLPEFFIDTIIAEPVPSTGLVRLYCGAKRHNEVNWLYSAVMPAEAILMAIAQCNEAANVAWNDAQMLLDAKH